MISSLIKWREREHNDVDRAMHGDLPAQKAMQMCGFYELRNLGSMRDQPILLQILIKYWDLDIEAFILDGHRGIHTRWDGIKN